MASVVVLDSEDTVRTVMTAVLERGGHQVRATGDFEEVFSFLERSLPDLVITNVFLHGITGHEAMLKLRGRFPQVPILMVSGLPDDDVIRTWSDDPGFEVFPKPFRADSLLTKVEEVIGNKPK